MPSRRSLPPLVVGLLVGGASRRFGRPKAMEPLDGRAFAERVAAALEAVAGEVVLLGGGPVPPSLEGRARLADAPDAAGPLAGLLAALRARPDRAWLVAACDQPYLTEAACRWLAGARSPGRLAVLPRAAADRVHPFPAVYEPAALPVLEELARSGDLSLQPLGRRPDVATPLPPPEVAAALLDFDDAPAPGAPGPPPAPGANGLGSEASIRDRSRSGSRVSDETVDTGQPGEGAEALLLGLGTLAGGRYRIERFLGRGAGGEVYAARDGELGGIVALKALRTGGPDSPHGIDRFKREILLARRITHANVCKVFEFGVHRSERAGEPRDVPFLTMELLQGTTLARRIAAEGPYTEEAALPLVRQLAAGLAGAHAAGVVHRDFKSSNILLVGDAAEPRAVITDFGLARDQEAGTSALPLTVTGGLIGTPAYMAPEQVQGRSADERSDIYALGVVLYEMVTGRLPFQGESPLEIAVNRLRVPPTPPESYRTDLSPRLRGVLKRCLAREPQERFGSPLEVVSALEGESAPAAPARRRRHLGLAAAVAAMALVASGLAWRAWRPDAAAAPAAPAGPVSARPSIAFLGVHNATGRPESEWLSAALPEMLTTELAAGDAVRAVPGETVARVRSDLGLDISGSLAPETLGRIRRSLSADLVVLGSFTALGELAGGRLRLDLRVQPTAGGAVSSVAVEGTERELFELVARAGRDLRGALALPAGSRSERSATPRSAEAARFYGEGLARLRGGEPVAARERFEAALAEEGDFALAWSALAETWSKLGWSQRATEAARRAWELSAGLPRAEALLILGRYRSAERDWPAAIEAFRELWAAFPDDLEHGLLLANVLIDADRGDQALAVIAQLHALPEPARGDPRVDLAEGRAAEGLSDYARQVTASRRAAESASARGARSALALAHLQLGVAHRRLGDPVASRADLAEARRLFGEIGDRDGVSSTLLSLGNLERGQGRLEEAAALFAESREISAALGNRRMEGRAELSQGLVQYKLGDLAGGVATNESALARLREVGDRRGAAVALANLGAMLSDLGEPARALPRLQETLDFHTEVGDQSRRAVGLKDLGLTRSDLGELDSARALAQEALALARQVGHAHGEGFALELLADLDRIGGDDASARARYEEAASIFRAATEEEASGRIELALILLDRERDTPERSEARLAGLERELEHLGLTSLRDETRLQRARSLAALRRFAEAQRLVDLVEPRQRDYPGLRASHLARLVRAELEIAQGRPRAALAPLERGLSGERERRQAIFALETRAVLARALAAAHDAAGAPAAASAREDALRLGARRVARFLDGEVRWL